MMRRVLYPQDEEDPHGHDDPLRKWYHNVMHAKFDFPKEHNHHIMSTSVQEVCFFERAGIQMTIPPNRQFHNSGYEHLKSIYILKEAQAKAPLQTASMYILPLLALKSARLAIDEYINLTGQKVDPTWDEIDRKVTPIRERIAYVFGKGVCYCISR